MKDKYLKKEQFYDFLVSLIQSRMTINGIEMAINEFWQTDKCYLMMSNSWDDPEYSDYKLTGSTEDAAERNPEILFCNYDVYVLPTKEKINNNTVYYITEIRCDFDLDYEVPSIVRLVHNLDAYSLSSYNEDTEDQLDYYLDERNCSTGDKAYLYKYENDTTKELKIVKIITRSNNPEYYDCLLVNDDVLINGEDEYHADTSAEFITDNDCYLVWFKEI